jgi:LPS sulfotransferase NodH
MNPHKVFILGTQRTGSTLACDIIANSKVFLDQGIQSNLDIINGYELLNRMQKHDLIWQADNHIKLHVLDDVVELDRTKYESHKNSIIDKLTTCDLEQAIVFKVLAEGLLSTADYSDIIKKFSENDFVIFRLDRKNKEEQLLSFILAVKYNIWNSSKLPIAPIHVSDEYIEYCKFLLDWDEKINTAINANPDVDIKYIHYETLISDLSKNGYNVKYNNDTRFLLRPSINYQAIIENADYVMDRIHQLVITSQRHN